MKITIIENENKRQIEYKEGDTLQKTLLENGIYVDSPCAGKGSCGKCKVQFLEDIPNSSAADREKLTKEELERGIRLACKAYPKKACSIALQTKETPFFVVTEGIEKSKEKSKEKKSTNKGYGIIIDIGTTTVVMQLVLLSTNSILKTYAGVNEQRIYGADVISRIQASSEGKKEELQKLIQDEIVRGMDELVDEIAINQVMIAGNTTMIHLLLGHSTRGLAEYPFQPSYEGAIKSTVKDIFLKARMDAPVYILPHFSPFVGGDIMAGMAACDFMESEEINFFLDIGTNAEMAVGNKEKVLIASAAAGPAFEAGNISCGVGSIAGAICHVKIEGDEVKTETIMQAPPCGICGSGVLETVYELLENGIIDETGLLEDTYFESGFLLTKMNENEIRLTQKDIREIQLAKAAIYAGIKTLLARFQITEKEIHHIYIAGGFGYHMNMEKAVAIGLLPHGLKDKVKIVGNTALSGQLSLLQEESIDEKMISYQEKTKEVVLATDGLFSEYYMNAMYLKQGE